MDKLVAFVALSASYTAHRDSPRTLKEKERELNANSLGNTKYFSLKYVRSIFDQKNNAADAVVRKFANELN